MLTQRSTIGNCIHTQLSALYFVCRNSNCKKFFPASQWLENGKGHYRCPCCVNMYEPWKTGTTSNPRVPAQKILVLQGGVCAGEKSGSAASFPGADSLDLDAAIGSAGGDEESGTRLYLCEWTDTITSNMEDELKLIFAGLKK